MFDVKTVVSPKPVDCGATCMDMLISYYGIDVDLDTLIKDCHTSLRGCTGRDLMECGRKYGLDMIAYDMDAEELVRQDRPAIVWWKYRHFIMFCGQDEDGNVVVINPDRGRFRLSFGTFKSFATGLHAGMATTFWNGDPKNLPERENA